MLFKIIQTFIMQAYVKPLKRRVKIMKILSVVNQKGGVGKTTTSVNLAIGLANKGHKVLAIDLDAQGSMSISLGITNPDDLDDTITSILSKIINDEDISENECIQTHEENIHFIPANIDLLAVEMNLLHTINRESILKKYIKNFASHYDYIIIDCSPSLGMLTINALACSDEIIIPLQAHYLSIKGMEQLLKTVYKVKKEINEDLIIRGILLTMVDMRTNHSKDILALLHETYDTSINIFDTTIPFSVRASETSITGKSIYNYDPKGKVAIAYNSLVQEVIG